ncbi:unnamed protein product [Urochloa humidicola]
MEELPSSSSPPTAAASSLSPSPVDRREAAAGSGELGRLRDWMGLGRPGLTATATAGSQRRLRQRPGGQAEAPPPPSPSRPLLADLSLARILSLFSGAGCAALPTTWMPLHLQVTSCFQVDKNAPLQLF